MQGTGGKRRGSRDRRREGQRERGKERMRDLEWCFGARLRSLESRKGVWTSSVHSSKSLKISE